MTGANHFLSNPWLGGLLLGGISYYLGRITRLVLSIVEKISGGGIVVSSSSVGESDMPLFVINSLFYSPFVETAQLLIVLWVLLRLRVRLWLAAIGAALPLLLLHLHPNPVDALVVAPLFLLSCLLYAMSSPSSFQLRFLAVFLGHQFYNIPPTLYWILKTIRDH